MIPGSEILIHIIMDPNPNGDQGPLFHPKAVLHPLKILGIQIGRPTGIIRIILLTDKISTVIK
jgi:hypothetical protein